MLKLVMSLSSLLPSGVKEAAQKKPLLGWFVRKSTLAELLV